jgi:hypothetical protein
MDTQSAALARLDAHELAPGRNEPAAPYDFREHYWLARPAFSKDFASEVWTRYKKHSDQWNASGDPIAQAVWKSYRTYHGISSIDSTASTPDIDLVENGDDGALISMAINHYRSLVRHKLALNTAQRAAWDPQARTSGAEAMKQVRLTRNICDYYWTAKRFDQRNYDQAELMEIAGVGFCVQGWDYNAGLGAQGDVWAQTIAPWEMCHQDVRNYLDCRFWIFVRWESRWDWVARLAKHQPEQAKRLAELDVDDMFTCGVRTLRPEQSRSDTDQIPLLYVYANASTSCPHGRLAIVAQSDLTLVDTPLPYGPVAPVSRMCAAEYCGTSKPLANSWSMLPLMDGLYVAVTAVMTRLDFGAVPDVAISEDTEFEQGDLGGLNLLRVPEGTTMLPTLVDAMQIPPVLTEVIKLLVSTMEAMTGINSVTRGQPDANITSGSMAALIQSMAAQYNSAEDRAYNLALEELGTYLIGIVQRLAGEGQLVSIAGEDERWAIKSFKAEDLNQIQRVAVKVVPAILKTLGGKMEIADKLLERGLIKHAPEYYSVLETGNLSSPFKGAVDELTMINSENERMRRGEPVYVLITDNPYLHIQHHKCELDTDARDDPEYTKRQLEHITEHFRVANEMSLKTPDMCHAMGWEPFPQAASIAQAVQQMQGGGSMPTPPAPAPQERPNAEPRAKPGPEPKPPGDEPSQAAPAVPMPAKPAAPAAPPPPA